MEDKDLVRIETAIEKLQLKYDTLVTNQYQFQTQVIEKLNLLLDNKIDKSLKPIIDDISELKKDVKEIKDKRDESTTWNFRQIILLIVSFLLSGGAIGVIEFFLRVYGK